MKVSIQSFLPTRHRDVVSRRQAAKHLHLFQLSGNLAVISAKLQICVCLFLFCALWRNTHPKDCLKSSKIATQKIGHSVKFSEKNILEEHPCGQQMGAGEQTFCQDNWSKSGSCGCRNIRCWQVNWRLVKGFVSLVTETLWTAPSTDIFPAGTLNKRTADSLKLFVKAATETQTVSVIVRILLYSQL